MSTPGPYVPVDLSAPYIRGRLDIYNFASRSLTKVSTMAFTKLTISALPTTRTDGSSATSSDYGSANVYKNGAKYATIAAPLSNGEVWTDTVAAVVGDKYAISVNDTQTPSVEGAQSAAYTVTSLPKAPLSAPAISGVTS